MKALKLERVSDDSWKPSHITGPNSFRSNKSSQNQISQVTCPPGPQQVTLMTVPITRQWDPTISHLEIQNQQPFKKNHKYKVVLFFQMWATKKNTFPITSTYSSLLFLTSMLRQATWAQICCVSSGWFVGIRFQAIHWGSPRSVWPMLQVLGWSIKGSLFLKVGNGKSRGWPSWSQVSSDFGGCF